MARKVKPQKKSKTRKNQLKSIKLIKKNELILKKLKKELGG